MSGLFLVFGLVAFIAGCGSESDDPPAAKAAGKDIGALRKEAQQERKKGNRTGKAKSAPTSTPAPGEPG
jgi:hypothetical protein